MKKVFLAVLFTVCCAQFLMSQTTLEEYNYLTKGYKIQLESGLDMKKGYRIIGVNSGTILTGKDKRFVRIMNLQRVAYGGDSINYKMTAAYLVIYQLNDGTKEYLCIPHPKSDKNVMQLYLDALHSDEKVNSSNRLQAIMYVASGALKW